jgi:hypothetical protein
MKSCLNGPKRETVEEEGPILVDCPMTDDAGQEDLSGSGRRFRAHVVRTSKSVQGVFGEADASLHRVHFDGGDLREGDRMIVKMGDRETTFFIGILRSFLPDGSSTIEQITGTVTIL